jgi:uncharacterized integral membrane protein
MIYLVLIIFMLMGSALAVLMWQNVSHEVQLTLFIWQMPHVSLGLLIVVTFLLGAVLLYITSVLSALRDKREMTRLRKRVSELEQASIRPVSGPLQGHVSPQIVPMPGIPPGIPPPPQM